ncbi:MAG: hypothetical protein Q4C95_11400 [Planctomycetia bacterium]|nr:hypothetical protein [Planctomycetia bacterium]
MNWEPVENYFRDFLLSLDIHGVTKDDISMPNKVFQPAGKRLWFEISTGCLDSVIVTERTVIYPAEVNLIVCVPINTGTQKANDIASLMQRQFSQSSIRTLTGFCISEPGKRIKVYINKAVQLAGYAFSDAYKINVRVSIDTWEED